MIIRTLAGLAVLVFFLPFSASPANSAWAHPFMMRIVDPASGEGLARVRVTSDEGYVCYTRADGSVLWTESSLMSRRSFASMPLREEARHCIVTPDGYARFSVSRAGWALSNT